MSDHDSNAVSVLKELFEGKPVLLIHQQPTDEDEELQAHLTQKNIRYAVFRVFEPTGPLPQLLTPLGPSSPALDAIIEMLQQTEQDDRQEVLLFGEKVA